jgi:hypothetical protein
MKAVSTWPKSYNYPLLLLEVAPPEIALTLELVEGDTVFSV